MWIHEGYYILNTHLSVGKHLDKKKLTEKIELDVYVNKELTNDLLSQILECEYYFSVS